MIEILFCIRHTISHNTTIFQWVMNRYFG